MPKISYVLSAIVLISSLAVQPVVAWSKDSNYRGHSKQVSQWGGKSHASAGHSEKYHKKYSNKGHKANNSKHKHVYSGSKYKKNKAHYKSKKYYRGHGKFKSAKPVYYGKSKHRYYNHKHKHYYKHRYYKPKYVYVKPYYGPRFYGYYPFRGHYWPFVNVSFVVNLSDRQIERHHNAVYTALDARVGDTVTWYDKGRHGTVVILDEGIDSSGNICKKYRQTISYRGHVNSQIVVSCLSPDGYWVTP